MQPNRAARKAEVTRHLTQKELRAVFQIITQTPTCVIYMLETECGLVTKAVSSAMDAVTNGGTMENVQKHLNLFNILY
jgi:hypothetical protein